MPKLIIHRSEAFRRGDLSIQIAVDGKTAGNLRGDASLELELAPGTYQLRASSVGMQGKKQMVEILPHTDKCLQVRVPKFKRSNVPVIMLIAVACGVPDRLLGHYTLLIKGAVLIACIAFTFFNSRAYFKQALVLEPMPARA